MSISRKTITHALVATATMATLGIAAPQASATENPSIAGVVISPKASAATRALAAMDPKAVQDTANLCGAGYKLELATRLPDARRFGTLFEYQNGASNECALFDNNLGTSKYMKLSVCEVYNGHRACSTDAGNFTQYAGPVRVTYGFCANITAIMKDSAGTSDSSALINRVVPAVPCD
ncbi:MULTISPECIES: hypothetical protein [unclassified Streptomyces]|uniref:hypothetical protein n=1 Tax=unclassified Streptomyces TaxID=2593676 RepID=UPI0038190E73